MSEAEWSDAWKHFPPGGFGRYWGGVGPVFWVKQTMDRGQFDAIAAEVRMQLTEKLALVCPACGVVVNAEVDRPAGGATA